MSGSSHRLQKSSWDSGKPVQTSPSGGCFQGAHCPPVFLVVLRAWGTTRCRALIARPASYLTCVRVQAAVEPGFQEARLGPPPPPAGRSPRMLLAALDAADCPSVSLSSARENSMLAPSRRGPHPFTSHPPLPSWQGDGKRQLISSPHSACGLVLNSLRLITEHLISASPQRGVWGRLEVSVYSILRRLCANHKQTGTQPCPPSAASASSSYLATFMSPPHSFSFSSFLPSAPWVPLRLSCPDLIVHTPLPVVLVSPEPRCPICTSHFSWGAN